MGTSDVHLAATRLCTKLDELGIPYAICGGLAVNAHGHQRATTDIDVLLTSAGLRGEHFASALHPYVQPKYRELWGYAQRPTNLPE